MQAGEQEYREKEKGGKSGRTRMMNIGEDRRQESSLGYSRQPALGKLIEREPTVSNRSRWFIDLDENGVRHVHPESTSPSLPKILGRGGRVC